MTRTRLAEIARRAYELHVLASEELGVTALPPLPDAPAASALTARQRDVMRLVAQGKNNGEIAAALDVTEKTVRNAITGAYACLGVRNRILAALIYRQMCEAPA